MIRERMLRMVVFDRTITNFATVSFHHLNCLHNNGKLLNLLCVTNCNNLITNILKMTSACNQRV